VAPGGPPTAAPGGLQVAVPGGPQVVAPGGPQVAVPGGPQVVAPGGLPTAAPGGPQAAAPGRPQVAAPGGPPAVSVPVGARADAPAGMSVLSRIGVPPLVTAAAAEESGEKVVSEPPPPVTPPPAAGPAPEPKATEPPGRKLAVTALTISLLALGGTGAVAYLVYRLGAEPPEPARPRPVAAEATTGLPVTYAKEALDIRVGCAAIAYLDLDEPRAGSSQQVADLRYDSKCGSVPARLSLGPGATAGSSVPTANLDADDCQRSIRNGPLGPGAEVPVRKGSALCVLTASDPAKLVLVEITDVGPTGTAGLRATSWLARK
jgi:hypothetical protein